MTYLSLRIYSRCYCAYYLYELTVNLEVFGRKPSGLLWDNYPITYGNRGKVRKVMRAAALRPRSNLLPSEYESSVLAITPHGSLSLPRSKREMKWRLPLNGAIWTATIMCQKKKWLGRRKGIDATVEFCSNSIGATSVVDL